MGALKDFSFLNIGNNILSNGRLEKVISWLMEKIPS
jgi:hypothetical protein